MDLADRITNALDARRQSLRKAHETLSQVQALSENWPETKRLAVTVVVPRLRQWLRSLRALRSHLDVSDLKRRIWKLKTRYGFLGLHLAVRHTHLRLWRQRFGIGLALLWSLRLVAMGIVLSLIAITICLVGALVAHQILNLAVEYVRELLPTVSEWLGQ